MTAVAAKPKKKKKIAPVDTPQAVVPYYSHNSIGVIKATRLKSALDAGDCHAAGVIFTELEQKYYHAMAEMQNRVSRTTGLKWSVTPAAVDGKEPDAKAREIAGFVEAKIKAIENFTPSLKALVWQGIGCGAALGEIFWILRGSEVVIEKIDTVKPFRWFAYMDITSPQTLLDFPRWQTRENPTGLELDRARFIYHAPLAIWDHAVQSGLYRSLSWLYLFTQIGIKDWLTLLDLYAVPMRVGKYKPSTPQADRDALKAAVQGMGVDAAAVISDDTAIEILSNSITGTAPHSAFISWAESLASKRITSQTLSGDQQKSSSSLAMAQVHENTVNMVTDEDARALEATIMRDLVIPLVDFNYGPQDEYPAWAMGSEEVINVGVELDNLQKVKNLGYDVPADVVQKITGYEVTPRAAAPDMPQAPQPGDPAQAAQQTPNSLRANSLAAASASTVAAVDEIFNDAEVRLAPQAYAELYADVARRVDGEDIRPMTPAEIEGSGIYKALLAMFLTAAVAAEAVAKAEAAGAMAKAVTANSLWVNALDHSSVPKSVITPDVARAWWINKLSLPAEDFDALTAREKMSAFTVAQNEDVGAIRRLKDLFTKALNDKKTELLTFRGWLAEAEQTGVDFIDRAHAETVFRTNLASAYEAQRHMAYQGEYVADVFEAYTIHTAGDENTCPICGALSGVTLPRGDAYWKTHWPPFHFNCRCTVAPVSKYENYSITRPDKNIKYADGFTNPALARFGAVSDPGRNF
ncbi:MAG: DUF935 family protein [Nitrospinae bacterium]|nr:DUF935 family protein [Nitrospinota bacterium]